MASRLVQEKGRGGGVGCDMVGVVGGEDGSGVDENNWVEDGEGREGFGVVGNNFATLGEFKFTYLL